MEQPELVELRKLQKDLVVILQMDFVRKLYQSELSCDFAVGVVVQLQLAPNLFQTSWTLSKILIFLSLFGFSRIFSFRRSIWV